MLSKGIGLFPTEPIDKMRSYVQLCESLGYESVWFGDSQNIWRESSLAMGAAAVGTERIMATLIGHPAREDVVDMVTAAKRAASLTRQLLAFSRREAARHTRAH